MSQTAQLRKGMVIRHEGQLYTVTDFHVAQSGKQKPTVHVKLHAMHDGHLVERTLSQLGPLEEVASETREMQYLYVAGEERVFMDPDRLRAVLAGPGPTRGRRRLPRSRAVLPLPQDRRTPGGPAIAGGHRHGSRGYRSACARRRRQQRLQGSHARQRTRRDGAAVHQERRSRQDRHCVRHIPRQGALARHVAVPATEEPWTLQPGRHAPAAPKPPFR